MSDLTPNADVLPPSDTMDQPSDEATETVESLKEKLAAEQAERLKAEEEVSTWKGRVKETNPPKKKEDAPDAYTDWRIDNRDRLSVSGVKEAYEKELADFAKDGVKLTNTLRDKALTLAEGFIGVKKVETHEPLPSGTVDRGGSADPIMTASDVQFGVNPEIKKKWAHIVEA